MLAGKIVISDVDFIFTCKVFFLIFYTVNIYTSDL